MSQPPFDDRRRAVLRALCDTVVPSLLREHDPDGLWARSATSAGVDVAAEQALLALAPAQRDGLLGLLDALDEQRFADRSQASREQTLLNVALLGGGPAAAGVGALVSLVLFLAYGMADPSTGLNANWAALGYPGPPAVTPPPRQDLQVTVPDGDELVLEADAVVVGSGAGGAVAAAVLASSGLRVVVLEAGPYRSEEDFTGLELAAYQDLYWRGGPTPSADLNITLMAGAALGGGTTVNWTNCLRTRPWVRDEWAAAGLDDVATRAFDAHLDAVWSRLGVTDDCSEPNGVQRRMRDGARALGWAHSVAARNVDPERYDAASGGHLGFGDRSGAKRSTVRTYLQDAHDAGARIVAGCTVDRLLVGADGRAAGVTGTWTDRDDPARAPARVEVRAPRVVVAAGALETPALLLRSGIGGPAAGHGLHLHPTVAALGGYTEDLQAWWGAPHALLVDEFESGADAEGFGFRIEGTQYAPGLIGSAAPFTTAAAHKEQMERFRTGGTFLGRIRDRGAGRVTVDDAGQAVVTYALTDPVDVATMHRAFDALARLHEAAGASDAAILATGGPTWRRGDDLEAFIARLRRLPLRAGGVRLFTAHQMGSARMGTDPATSVADPRGELHDTPGVWIGDASAFPTASGTNPMISVMALAHRTATTIAAEAGATRATAAAQA
jgi:choline dehydrogenase-like flavoprotein